jgi:hypothetical protein
VCLIQVVNRVILKETLCKLHLLPAKGKLLSIKQFVSNRESTIQATVVGDHIELHLSNATHESITGFVMLKSNRAAVPVY